MQSVFLQLAHHGGLAGAEHGRHLPGTAAERGGGPVAHLLVLLSAGGSGLRRQVRFPAALVLLELPPEVPVRDDVLLRAEQQALDDVLHLPDVAGPAVLQQGRFGVGRKALLHAELLAVLLQEALSQREDGILPFPQRGHIEIDHIDAVVEVLPEKAPLHQPAEVAVGGQDHPDIHRDRLAAAHAHHLPGLQDPQQLHLAGELHVPDLIQEEGAAVGGLHQAGLCPHGAGEGALHVAKELTLHQLPGHAGAVYCDKGALLAAADVVQVLGKEALAGAGLPQKEAGDVGIPDGLERQQELVRGCGPSPP